MWCRKCQQDVPGLAAAADGRLSCPRCRTELPLPSTAAKARRRKLPAREAADGPAEKPAPAYSMLPPDIMDWEAEERLRHIERVLGRKAADPKDDKAYRREAARFDLPHAQAAGWHPGLKPQPAPAPAPTRTASGLGGAGWLALALGTMAFVCGGVLMGWSLVTGRQQLWTIGLPITLGGQIGLLVGLVLQLERIWRDSRRAAAKLDTVDEQLHDLKTTATLMGTGGNTPGSTFYAHLAHGASNELLLTDLKGQLDLLAMKLSRDAQP
jgi:hypothetical protein